MIQSVLNSTAVPLLEQVVRFSENRQRLLASNIANIDTPNYKPRDLPVETFQQALRDAVAAREKGQGTAGSFASRVASEAAIEKSVEGFFPEELFQPVQAPPQNITFQDGNNRNIETATMAMMKNAAMQRFAVEVITAQLNMLQAVISERA